MKGQDCSFSSVEMQQWPRSRRHGKDQTRRISVFAGSHQRDLSHSFGKFDHGGLRSTSMGAVYSKPSINRRILKTQSYSTISSLSADQFRYLSSYMSHSFHEPKSEVEAELHIHDRIEGLGQEDCQGVGQKSYSTPIAGASYHGESEDEWQRDETYQCRKTRNKALFKAKKERRSRSFKSDVREEHVPRDRPSLFKELDRMSNGVIHGGQSFVSMEAGKEGGETESGNVHVSQKSVSRQAGSHKIALGSGCFARANNICSAEGSVAPKHGSLGTVFQSLRCRKINESNQPDERCKATGAGKGSGKPSLKNFSCISSGDVLPSITNCLTNGTPGHLLNKQKTETCSSKHKDNGLRSVASLAGNNSRCTTRSPLSHVQSKEALASASKARRLSFMRRASMKADTLVSRSTAENVNAAVRESSMGPDGIRACAGVSIHRHEGSSRSTNNEGPPLKLSRGRSDKGLSSLQSQSGTMDENRTNASGFWVDSGSSSETTVFGHGSHNASSSIFSGVPSSRPPAVPSPFETPHYRRHFEPSSSPSSYMSSPDVQFSSADTLCSYPSTFQSPNLNRAVSSPDNRRHHLRATETPIFRPFRHFPPCPFEQIQPPFSFGGLSEILSNRERAERDEISYELFMMEANMLLGGLALHDQHRDLRLDVDNMSYEELLALEESIGNVSTGLEKDAISRCLQTKNFSFADMASTSTAQQDHGIKCSICQEEFEEGIELGVLSCGHNHHASCIEQWLRQKNQCPICKASAS